MAANADVTNKKSVVTINEQVALPGMVLQPGTYVFKLDDSDRTHRNVVQVWNENENQLIGKFLTVRDYRMETSGNEIIRFEQKGSSGIETVKGWFYPGDRYGHAFVYPKSDAVELARANQQEVPSVSTMPDKSAQDEQLRQAEVHKIDPSGNESRWQDQSDAQGTITGDQSQIDRDQAARDQAARDQAARDQAARDQAARDQMSQQQQQSGVQDRTTQDQMTRDQSQDTLPRTASNLPLFGLIGLLALGVAVVLSLALRRLS
jgi:hypothetical protein